MVIETERLLLREFEFLDAEPLFQLNNNPNVLIFTGDDPFSTVKESEEFVLNYPAYNDFGYGRWAVILKSTNTFIGWCGLKFHEEENYTDLGFRFFEEYWNKGFATESSGGVIEYAFTSLGLSTLVARVQIENAASIKVLGKLGFNFLNKIEFNESEGLLYALYKTKD